MLTQNEMNVVNKLVALVDGYSEHGEDTDNEGFIEQPYMGDLLMTATENGYKLLGSGHFSGAFSHKELPGKAIKVGLKKEDSGAAYAAWCRANQHLEGVPVIHHIARHTSCYTVVLDELTPYQEAVRPIRPAGSRDGQQTEAQQDLITSYGAAKQGIYGANFTKEMKHKGIYDTCLEIHKFFNGVASFDLHSENIMAHPVTGKIVITDPVSFVKDGALEGFDIELDMDKKRKQVERVRAQHRLKGSTERLVYLIGGLRVLVGLAIQPQTGMKRAVRLLADKHKANLALDQLRNVTLDLDKRLQVQFIRG